MKRRDLLRLAGCGAGALALSQLLDPARDMEAQVARKGLLGRRPSPLFSDLDGNRIRCQLCPHWCELAPGERGRCRVRENRDGRGYTLVHGNPCIVQSEPVERKPFFHVVPGSRSLSLATAGCNLECRFCEVWDTALVGPEDVHAFDLPPSAIVEKAVETGARSVAYTFGEPVAYFEYMKAVGAAAKEAGLLSLMHSAGYINPEPLEQLCAVLHAANIDLKGFDADFYRRVCGGELQPVLDSLRTLQRNGLHIEITNILIPSMNDDMGMVREMCEWIVGEIGPDTPLHFARFYPLYKLANLPPTPVSTLDQALDTAREAGLHYVYVAKVPGHDAESTSCAGCHQTIIRRIGYMVEDMHMDGDRCNNCGQVIPGIWS